MSESLTAQPKPTEGKLIVVSPGRPAYPARAKDAFGVSPGDWRALVDAVWPSAKTTEAIELALSYCRARQLDPFKRPVHIVPVWDSKKGVEVETVWPGVSELRTTASRTGAWAGYDEAVFGPEETHTFKGQYAKEVEKTVSFPVWCQITVYRFVQGQRLPFPGPKVRWLETYATMGASDVPNEMWTNRPYGQLEKCAEAAALRRAFPEEVGSDLIAEEAGRRGPALDVTPQAEPGLSRSDALLNRLTAPATPAQAFSAAAEELAAAQEPPDLGSSGPQSDDLVKVATPLASEADRPAESNVGPAEPSPEELRGQLEALLAEHLTAEERKSAKLWDLLQRHFGTRSYRKVTELAAEPLAAGLASLREELAHGPQEG